MATKLSKKLHVFAAQTFINLFLRRSHQDLNLRQTKSFHITPRHISLRSILILSLQLLVGLSSDLLRSRLSNLNIVSVHNFLKRYNAPAISS